MSDFFRVSPAHEARAFTQQGRRFQPQLFRRCHRRLHFTAMPYGRLRQSFIVETDDYRRCQQATYHDASPADFFATAPYQRRVAGVDARKVIISLPQSHRQRFLFPSSLQYIFDFSRFRSILAAERAIEKHRPVLTS